MLAGLAAAQPGALEKAGNPGGLPTEWPEGPAAAVQPSWATPGKIRFARWDGGRLETAKAMLSGWPGFNPPLPDRIDSMTNWYAPRTVELLSQARVNTIWVTFSVGFSLPAERGQQEELRRYIAACHRAGIRVFAYQSIANLFWEDMFEQVPESKDWVRLDREGKPTPYGAASYSKMGRVTRYMARIAHPGWLDYLKQRVDLALDAGADGIFYDNNFNESLAETYQAIYRHAAARKRDVLLMGNFHSNTYVLNRLTNAISTEDGWEPGVWNSASPAAEARDLALLPRVGGGPLVNNLGLYRMLQSLSEGWKPVQVECGHREIDHRFTRAISGPRHQLAIAEAAASGAAMELFSEGAFADDLWRGRPEAMKIWGDIARYHRFLEDNEALYAGARPAARLAILADEGSQDVPLLNALAARHVLFDVVHEHDARLERLRPYRAVALLSAAPLRPRVRDALSAFVAQGGKLLAVAAPGLPAAATVWEALPSPGHLAAALRAATPLEVSVNAPAGVLHVVTTQPAQRRSLVHVLNYTGRMQTGVAVAIPGSCQAVKIYSPDSGSAEDVTMRGDGAGCLVSLPRLSTYSVVAWESAAR
jgi:hypothetical protein